MFRSHERTGQDLNIVTNVENSMKRFVRLAELAGRLGS